MTPEQQKIAKMMGVSVDEFREVQAAHDDGQAAALTSRQFNELVGSSEMTTEEFMAEWLGEVMDGADR